TPRSPGPVGRTSPFSRGRSLSVGLQGGLHTVVGLPDLLGHVRELLEVLGAVTDLLLPAGVVDAQDGVEVVRVDLEALEVELLLLREDADRGLHTFDLAVLELHEPEQRAQVVAVAGPQEATVLA